MKMNDCPHFFEWRERLLYPCVYIYLVEQVSKLATMFIRSLPDAPASRSIDDSGDESEKLIQDAPVRST